MLNMLSLKVQQLRTETQSERNYGEKVDFFSIYSILIRDIDSGFPRALSSNRLLLLLAVVVMVVVVVKLQLHFELQAVGSLFTEFTQANI